MNYLQIDARSDRTGEVIFKDNFQHTVAGVVQVSPLLVLFFKRTSYIIRQYGVGHITISRFYRAKRNLVLRNLVLSNLV